MLIVADALHDLDREIRARPVIPPGHIEKLQRHVTHGGFMALALRPLSCPRGFAFCFIDVPRPIDIESPKRDLCVLEMTTRSWREALIADVRGRSWPLDQLPLALDEAVRHFDQALGHSAAFIEGVQMPAVFLDQEETLRTRDLPTYAHSALGRIFEAFSIREREVTRMEINFKVHLRNVLDRVMRAIEVEK